MKDKLSSNSKKKITAIVAALALVLALGGVMAYLADADGTVTNKFEPNHVKVGIDETTGEDYNIIPGTEQSKDPKVTVDTDTDAYVYAIVKDTVNANGKTLVTYDIADGWIELDKSKLTPQEIEHIVNGQNKGTVTIDPTDENTKIYYRVVHGTDEDSSFEYPILKDNKVSYASDLTNEDLALLDEDPSKNTLEFQTYAIQMVPFCDADATDEDTITQGAIDAWNQTKPVSGHIKWQVQLHSVNNGTYTFWPAMTKNYGKQEHDGDCICDHTWAEIASGSYDFSSCHCTKTVTIDETQNTSIFTQGLSSDQTSGVLFSTLQSEARCWETSGDNTVANPSYKSTLAAMKSASDISGVAVSDFFLLSTSDVGNIAQNSRIIYNESGEAEHWWLANTYDTVGAYYVYSEGYLSIYYVNVGASDYTDVHFDGIGIAPGFSISAGN